MQYIYIIYIYYLIAYLIARRMGVWICRESVGDPDTVQGLSRAAPTLRPVPIARRCLGTLVKASCSEVSQPVTQGTGLAVWLPDIKSSMRTCRKTAQGCGPVNSVISSIQWIHILYLSSCLPALKVFFIVLYSNECYASVMILLRRQPLLNLIFCHSIIVSQTGKIQIRLEQCILKMRLKNRLLFETVMCNLAGGIKDIE